MLIQLVSSIHEKHEYSSCLMKLHIYQGDDVEVVPKDITHVIVDDKVTAIKEHAFKMCRHHLVSIIMGDNVKRIERKAFAGCYALNFVRLSTVLEYIGFDAFKYCHSLEALFLPSTLKEIGGQAFCHCRSLRLLMLPTDIDLDNIASEIVFDTSIFQIAEDVGLTYEWGTSIMYRETTDESVRRVNEWLQHYMDETPLHKLCYNPSVTALKINAYFNENGVDAALAIDPYYGMTPLHIISMNPHAPADAIAALLVVNMEAALCMDYQGKISLDYAREYNVGGLVGMMNVLCNHRYAQHEK